MRHKLPGAGVRLFPDALRRDRDTGGMIPALGGRPAAAFSPTA
ncbi:MAG TPA: hypothetical protein VFY67_08915 [Pyrinomonadaceae bacterium]|nr:hypothetical protein [Pyrinomonadaceae bacterium]